MRRGVPSKEEARCRSGVFRIDRVGVASRSTTGLKEVAGESGWERPEADVWDCEMENDRRAEREGSDTLATAKTDGYEFRLATSMKEVGSGGAVFGTRPGGKIMRVGVSMRMGAVVGRKRRMELNRSNEGSTMTR